jgi:hypothetical protein
MRQAFAGQVVAVPRRPAASRDVPPRSAQRTRRHLRAPSVFVPLEGLVDAPLSSRPRRLS